MKKIDLEVKLGAIFGVIAIVSIFAEMILNGFSQEVVLGGIKDISGTIVDVLVFVFCNKEIFERKTKKEI